MFEFLPSRALHPHLHTGGMLATKFSVVSISISRQIHGAHGYKKACSGAWDEKGSVEKFRKENDSIQSPPSWYNLAWMGICKHKCPFFQFHLNGILLSIPESRLSSPMCFCVNYKRYLPLLPGGYGFHFSPGVCGGLQRLQQALIFFPQQYVEDIYDHT